MRLIVESTQRFDILDGMPVRIWRATTANGVHIELLVARLRVPEGAAVPELAELVEVMPPAVVGVVVELPREDGCCGEAAGDRAANAAAEEDGVDDDG